MPVKVVCNLSHRGVGLAATRLVQALRERGLDAPHQADCTIHLDTAEDVKLQGGESFRILREEGPCLTLRGGGATGVMYAALTLAQEIRQGLLPSEIAERVENPRFPFRAIKFNLPWMSYRRGPALQLHEQTCRDLAFWEAFLDQMAENRFNVLSLWGLHPFPLMIRPRGFPEACGLSDAQLTDWRKFWSALMRQAKDRGIETYLVVWNIFVSPEFARAHDLASYSIGWSHIGEGDGSELIKRYTRQCVTQVIDEYEDLAGLGITLGERMGGMSPREREQWIHDTFITGMKAATRPVRLIHRAPLSADKDSGGSSADTVEQMTRRSLEQLDLPEPIWLELKFNWSHGHSSPRLVQVHGGPLTEAYWNPPAETYRIVWTVRNEDVFCLRWGEPGFIRKHIELNGEPYVGGYFVGSECYIPAQDYFSKPDPRINWTYAFERQWFFYQAWGRLLYSPETPDGTFAAEFRRRYGPQGESVFTALVLGSRMPLRLASFYKATWDYTLYAEGFLAPAGSGGDPKGRSPLISVDALIDQVVMDPDLVSVKDYVAGSVRRQRFAADRVTPPQLADALERDGNEALRLIASVGPADGPIVFELADARAWAQLSLYFAQKLRGAVALQFFRTTGDDRQQRDAVEHLERAAAHWRELVRVTDPIIHVVPLMHLERYEGMLFHWSRFLPDVDRDVARARAG